MDDDQGACWYQQQLQELYEEEHGFHEATNFDGGEDETDCDRAG